MPIRANPATAALLAGGVSLSALILLFYLKLRSSNNRRQSLTKSEKSHDKPSDNSSKLVEKSFSADQSLSDCVAEETVKEQGTYLCETVIKANQLPEPLQSDAEATEESVSECENHLEEESEEVEEIVEEIIESEVKLQEEIAPTAAIVAMTTSTDALGDCATKNSNNNNDEEVVKAQTGLTVYTGDAKNGSENCENSTMEKSEPVEQQQEQDRVSNWLAKNDCYCRQPHQESHHHRHGQSVHRMQAACEDASDDSGRPSSVDTAGDAASPRCPSTAGTVGAVANNANRQSSSAVAVAMSLSPNLQQQQHCIEDHDDADESNNVGDQFPDRSKVIRGVSPVPGDENDIIHQFLIPNKLGGSMVGTRGRNINYIRAKSGASVWISRNFFDKKTQVVNVRGPAECVKSALQVIKKRFPELDVKPINTAVPIQRNPALQPTMCQLSLPVGALVDVNVCAMCRGTTVFMQQPTHPSFHHLEKMDCTIMKHYVDQSSVPALPRPVNPGAVCVAPFGSAWYRAIIADVFPEEDLVLMKYLDWGGYERMPVGCLKQIRTEMMHLPFQSVEGHLAYVSPILSEDEDPETQLEQLSRAIHERYLTGLNKRIKAQVVYFNDVGQPCVYLYTKDANSDSAWRFLQDDLVQDGLAQWFQMPHAPPQIPQ